jgi:hypothetical protein
MWYGTGFTTKLCSEYELLVGFPWFKIAKIRSIMDFNFNYTEKKY